MDNKVEDYMNEVLTYFGFVGFETIISVDHLGQKELVISNRLPLKAHAKATDVIDKVQQELEKRIQNSTFVQEQIRALQSEVSKLTDRVAVLEKYETYYDMQYEMSHGEKRPCRRYVGGELRGE